MTSKTQESRPQAFELGDLAGVESLTPHKLSDAELELLFTTDGTAAAGATAPEPDMLPPSEASTDSAGAALNGQLINALWSEQSNRNSWANFVTAGWKKLSPASDSGSTVMTLLAAHARAVGVAPAADENPAGTINWMYVW